MLRLSPRFYRAHGLGNDYLVVETASLDEPGWPLHPETVQAVCRRGFGVGSDGIIVLLDPGAGEAGPGPFRLRMFNPDGSEFERSGNGLRILGSYLRLEGKTGEAPFVVESGGERIRMQVHGVTGAGVHDVSVQMGQALAGEPARSRVAWTGGPFRALHPRLGEVDFVPVWVGNPHAVVFRDEEPALSGPGHPELDGSLLQELGPFLATHSGFGRGTNVQLAHVAADGSVHIGIWERGVGRTPASGTSSCAAAVAAVVTGRREPGQVRVRMPGGELEVGVSDSLEVELRGPVQEVERGSLTAGFMQGLRERVSRASQGAGRAVVLAALMAAGALGLMALTSGPVQAQAASGAQSSAHPGAQELGVFHGRGSSGLAELASVRGVGGSYRVRVSPRTAVRATLFSGEHGSARSSRVCIQYEPAVGCNEERVETVTGLRGLLLSGHWVQRLAPRVAVEGGAGVSLHRLQTREATVSGRRSNLFARNTAQLGAALLGTLRVGPVPRIPLLLEIGVAQHLVRLDACSADAWAYDPFCRTLENLELRVGAAVRFGPGA